MKHFYRLLFGALHLTTSEKYKLYSNNISIHINHFFENPFLDSDLCDVLIATISETRWFMLGVALHVEQHQLKRIKSNNRDAQECQNDMLYSWISTGNATWSGLVEALRSPLLDNQQLAREVEVKYMK